MIMLPTSFRSLNFPFASASDGQRQLPQWRFGLPLAGVLLVLLMGQSSAQEMKPAEATRLLGALKAEGADERIDALRELHVTLDPRLPEALLPLLRDEGSSIRRLAVRGIGSRWWQIPAKRVPAFVAELERNARSEMEGEREMAERGLGLLRRDYKGDSFSRSPNGRWVIYERYQQPCLIDTKNGTEELLGWRAGANIRGRESEGLYDRHFAVFRRPEEQLTSPAWHPRRDWAALEFFTRRTTSAHIWRHGAGLRELKIDRVVRLAKLDPRHHNADAGWSFHFRGWENDLVRYECSLVTNRPDEDLVNHTIHLTWDPAKDQLRLLSNERLHEQQ